MSVTIVGCGVIVYKKTNERWRRNSKPRVQLVHALGAKLHHEIVFKRISFH